MTTLGIPIIVFIVGGSVFCFSVFGLLLFVKSLAMGNVHRKRHKRKA